MTRGRFAFVLHCHIPYVLSHGRWPHGSDWLCEAAAETYLPLLRILEQLLAEGKHPKLTLDISPILCEQLASSQFKQEFKIYLDQRMSAAEHDFREFTAVKQTVPARTAAFWIDYYQGIKDQFHKTGEDILGAFKRLQDNGVVEILTCGATHGYFPLLSRDETIRAQVELARTNYEKFFARPPQGIWLPECGYRPAGNWTPPGRMASYAAPRMRQGVGGILEACDIAFFIAAGVNGSSGASAEFLNRSTNQLMISSYAALPGRRFGGSQGPSPRDIYSLEGSGVRFFVRDPETGLIVWSAEHGYPGDANYLEFHKRRFPSGHRYWAVTSPKSDLGDKTEYFRPRAIEKTVEHAVHFVNTVAQALADHTKTTGRPGIVVSPFDAELFGHWWFEGPEFLANVLARICDLPGIELTTLSEYVATHASAGPAVLHEGSWGMGGEHHVWFNDQTEWTWPIIYAAEERMLNLTELWRSVPDRHSAENETILKQTARELMLLVASDWQFLITTNSARDYAEHRFKEHARDFGRLAELGRRVLEGGAIDESERLFVTQCLQRDSVFPEMRLEWFA